MHPSARSACSATAYLSNSNADLHPLNCKRKMCTCIVLAQRVYGFSICAGCAICFGFLSTLFVVMPTKFAVLFTFSQVFAIARYAADALPGISCMHRGIIRIL